MAIPDGFPPTLLFKIKITMQSLRPKEVQHKNSPDQVLPVHGTTTSPLSNNAPWLCSSVTLAQHDRQGSTKIAQPDYFQLCQPSTASSSSQGAAKKAKGPSGRDHSLRQLPRSSHSPITWPDRKPIFLNHHSFSYFYCWSHLQVWHQMCTWVTPGASERSKMKL